MVDTQIWVYAKKRPSKSRFPALEDYARVLEAHELARRFFQKEYPSLKVYMSYHQVAELFHVMAFRGLRIPPSEALAFIRKLEADRNVVKVPVSPEHYLQAIKESVETGVHVWDFLCFLPVSSYIERVYSSDPHFKIICERFGVELVNPVKIWAETQRGL